MESHSKEPRIPIMECFGPTIQGEGLMSGTITNFLRTGGCGLRCVWCDTMFAVDPKQVRAGRTMMTVNELLVAINQLPFAPYLTLSGGDPCLHAHLGDIFVPLKIKNINIAVETQGELFPAWLKDCDVITFSPKPPSSGNIVDYKALGEWIKETYPVNRKQGKICIKVVVFNSEDLEYALNVYHSLPSTAYDAFYFTAGTPGYPAPPPLPLDAEPEVVEARAMYKIMGVVGGQRWLADQITMLATRMNFNYKVHVGCQQHVLMWPEIDRGK